MRLPSRYRPDSGLPVILVMFAALVSTSLATPFVEIPTAKLNAFCKNKKDGIYAIPSDCNTYVTCCSHQGFQRLCRACKDKVPFLDYCPNHGKAIFDNVAGECRPLDDTTADACRNGTANTRWGKPAKVKQFCSIALAGRKADAATQQRRMQLESGNATLSPSSSRKLLAAPPCPNPAVVGSYEQILNPELGRSSTGITAIHAALVPNSWKILLMSRHQAVHDPATCNVGAANSMPYEPGMENQVSGIYDAATGTYSQAPTTVSPFCTGHSHLSDGTIIAAGGEMPGKDYDCKAPWLEEGRDAIRLFDKKKQQLETLPDRMYSDHWYPTQVTLPDDRVIIAGGYYSLFGPPNPAVEIYDNKAKKITAYYGPPAPKVQPGQAEYKGPSLPIMDAMGWWNLYPAMHWLPWTNAKDPAAHYIYVFSCDGGAIYSIAADNSMKKAFDLPNIPTKGACSAYSATASSTFLAFKPENNYQTEVVMFGGSSTKDGSWCSCDIPAIDDAFRIKLSPATLAPAVAADAAAQWEVEKMPAKRVMGDAVMLPNGKIVILNGAQYGKAAGGVMGGGMSKTPVYEAHLYDPDAPKGQRFKVMASSTVKRLYHGNAMLLPSGDVWVSGSEQEECVDYCWKYSGPGNSFIAEVFKPHYSYATDRPVIVRADTTTAKFGATITIKYRGKVTGASIVAPGAATHQINMSQRVIFLKVAANAAPTDCTDPAASVGSVTVTLPPAAAKVALPGYYMLFLLNGDSYSTASIWINLTN